MKNKGKNPKEKQPIQLLYVDDLLTQRKNLNYILNNNGFDVTIADGGWHALHLIEENSFEAVLISDEIDDMLALEIVLLIRGKIDKEKLPVVVFDKSKIPEDVDTFYDAGADAFLTLSNPNNLIKRIRTLTGRPAEFLA